MESTIQLVQIFNTISQKCACHANFKQIKRISESKFTRYCIL